MRMRIPSNYSSQICVRKLACPCGHVTHTNKPHTTRNSSRKTDAVNTVRALQSGKKLHNLD